MHVTACLAKQEVDVEVGEDCRTIQALQEAIVKALPQLCVEGFDVSVGGRALDNDEGIASLEESVRLDVSANSRGLSVLALREAGREVSEAGLLAAVKDGDVVLCTLYLDAGVPLDCVDRQGATPLLLSCRRGHLEIARLLLDRGSTAIDEKDGEGDTPLLVACDRGQLEIATLLLDRGSTAIDEKGCSGSTPLHHACRSGNVEIARLLLDRGSTVIDVKDAIDEKDGAEDTEDAVGNTPLLLACRYGHLEVATLLLDRGAEVGETDEDNNTPLHVACEYGYVKVARLLLDRGHRGIDEENGVGETPLFIACAGDPGHLELATLLLDRGYRGNIHGEVFEERREEFSDEILELLSVQRDEVHDASVPTAKRRRTGKHS